MNPHLCRANVSENTWLWTRQPVTVERPTSWHHPETFIGIDWLSLAPAVESSPLAPLPGSLDACREDGPGGTFISLHTCRWCGSHAHTQKLYSHFLEFVKRILLELKLSLCVCVSWCRHVFIAVWTFCATRINWITPIHFIVSLPSLAFHTLPVVSHSAGKWRAICRFQLKFWHFFTTEGFWVSAKFTI